MDQNLEPVFSRQEQAVVYLFSRYWQKMKEFEGKTPLRIHTHFPDFIVLDGQKRAEAIEFEYALSSFKSHLRLAKDLGNLKDRLKEADGNFARRKFVLYIVFWYNDGNQKDILRRLRNKKIEPRLICLKDWFSAVVNKIEGTDSLHAFWKFTRSRKPIIKRAAYNRRELEREVRHLENHRIVKILTPRRDLYRSTGFDLSGSSFVEVNHWEWIHFYTTSTRFSDDGIPSVLFVKPNGCDYIVGYFTICLAFKIEPRVNPPTDLFRRFYFFPYDEDQHRRSTCFVCDFVPLKLRYGKRLFRVLKTKYNFGVRGSVKLKKADVDRVVKPRLLR